MSQVQDSTHDRALRRLNAYRMEQLRRAAAVSPPPDVRRSVQFRIGGIQKRARRQAEAAFARKDEDENSGPDSRDAPLSAYEKKKEMRNKSAFISRRRQKNYIQLLEELVERSEHEHKRELDQCVRHRVEIEQLLIQEQLLRDRLARIGRAHFAPPPPPPPVQPLLRASNGIMCSSAQRVVPSIMASSAQLLQTVPHSSPPMAGIVSEIRGMRADSSQFEVGGPSERFEVPENIVQDPLSEILDDAIREF